MINVTVKKAHIIGFILSSLLGTLLHFVFEWTGEWPPAGALSAVNESTWEHLKLLALPMLAFGVAEYFIYGRKYPGFITLRFLSILLGMLIITAGFYTYTGVVGRNIDAVNIILFELALLAAYRFSYRRMDENRFISRAANAWSLLGAATLLLLFIVFTYYPPHIGLFMDPLTGGFGLLN